MKTSKHNNEKYNLLMRTNHWVVAIIVIALVLIGLYLTYLMDTENPNFIKLIHLHKSFGIVIGVLMFLRLGTRIVSKVPSYPSNISRWEINTAFYAYMAIYALLFLMVISGYVMSVAGGHGVSFFGYDLPNLISLNIPLSKAFRLIHKLTAFGLIALLILHVGAVIKHYFVDKINLLNRII